MKLATIDIGTNTTLLLVARQGEDGGDVQVLDERAEITRLGRGIGAAGTDAGPGALGEAGIASTLAALRQFAGVIRQHGARLAVVGTEALRRAPNAEAFLGPAAAILGTPVEVIDGAREAALTFRAAVESFPAAAAAGWMAVVDIGGGSTEVVLADRAAVRFQTSLPLGSVRLTERFIHTDPATAAELTAAEREIAGQLAKVPFPAAAPVVLVGVAGTVTTLAAMAQDLASYDPARVHGWMLDAGTLRQQRGRLVAATQDQRERMVGLDPRRADVILAGALILEALLRQSGAPGVLVSDRGIRWGLLYEMRART